MFTHDQILKEIQRVATDLGKNSLSIAEFTKHGKLSAATVSNHFGSWNDAVQAAGLVPIDPIEIARSTPSISEEELLLDLIRLHNETGKTPTKALINAKGKYSDFPYLKKWGSHKNAFMVAQKRFPDKIGIPSPTPQAHHAGHEIKIVPKNNKLSVILCYLDGIYRISFCLHFEFPASGPERPPARREEIQNTKSLRERDLHLSGKRPIDYS